MRRQICFAIPLLAALGCAPSPAPVPAPQAAPPSMGQMNAPPPPAADALAGTVMETIDATQYTYLRLQTAGGEAWAAVPQAKIAVGSQARVLNAVWMQDFKSATLNRSWPRIAFGVLEGPAGQAPAAAQPAAAQAPGRTAGMFAQAAAGQGSPKAPPPDGTPIAVPRATGAGAHTIAEVFTQKGALKDQVVRVRGKVVKETDAVMGKNWLHLRDGSGKDGAADLTFATGDTSAVGETVVLSGVVHLDRDLGAGYHYDVLVEDAKIER